MVKNKMKLKRFVYLDNEGNGSAISIVSKRKPSINTEPRSGTWVVSEWVKGEWQMPCFPEITLRRLSKMIFVGILK